MIIASNSVAGRCRPTCHLPSFLPNVDATQSGPSGNVSVTLFTKAINISWVDDTCKAIRLT